MAKKISTIDVHLTTGTKITLKNATVDCSETYISVMVGERCYKFPVHNVIMVVYSYD